MPSLYPATNPHLTGMLDVGQGNRIFWEVSGNPEGYPVLVLHGGPGAGTTPRLRRCFSPEKYRIITFDQRGCGQSTPHASDPTVDMSVNTTEHILDDVELLRRHLGVESWVVFGCSWGAILAIAYATRYPALTASLVLICLTNCRRAETNFFLRGVRRFFPGAWEDLRKGAGDDGDGDGVDLLDAYHRLVNDPREEVRLAASQRWCGYGRILTRQDASDKRQEESDASFTEPRYALASARIITHYWKSNCWLDDGFAVLQGARLAGIPGYLVQGADDLNNLFGTPWKLSSGWADSKLTLVPGEGHDPTRMLLQETAGITDEMICLLPVS